MRLRHPDWESRLHALVESRRAEPFAWGRNDCVLWVADVIEAMRGAHPAPWMRGAYDDAAGALATCRRMFGGGIRAVFDGFAAMLPTPPVPIALAQRGDTALVRNEGRQLGAVVLGDHVAAPGATGLVLLPLRGALRAWAV